VIGFKKTEKARVNKLVLSVTGQQELSDNLKETRNWMYQWLFGL